MKQLVEQINRANDWTWLSELTQWVIEQAIAIQQIPAPTFEEAHRATYVANQFTSLKLIEVETDDLHNVYGLRRGSKSEAPGVMVTAHTDTVFPAEADLTIRREGNLIYGPGLGDNSLGVAALLGLARLLHDQPIEHDGDIWFVATVGEEGLGDLCGMKAAFARLQPRIQSVINLEGLAFEHVYHGGIAVRRLHITANAEGGHSWLNFGNSSAVHGIVQLGARITTLSPTTTPRTTYNIGIIEGGQTINTIAAQAGLWLDLRSEVQSALMELEQQVLAEIKALTTTQLTFTNEIVGDRPAGWLSPEHPLVQGAMAALDQLGIQATLETGSTDANIPLAAGCPAVTIGITRGGNAHRLDEYIDAQPVAAGLKQLILLVLAASRQENL